MGATASKAVAVAAVVAALAGTAACGGGDGGAEGKGAGAGGKTLTQEELVAAAVTGADLHGWQASGRRRAAAGARQEVPDPACRALYGMTAELGAERQRDRGAVQESVTSGEDDVTVVLRSYTAADAAQLMADLRTSLKTCPARFDSPIEGETYSHTERLKDPAAGDDALAYRTVQTIPGEDPDDVTAAGHGLYHVVVVRCGATIATFSAFAMDGDPAAVPAKVVTAQAAKLARAAGRA
jgi:hypothetical protein